MLQLAFKSFDRAFPAVTERILARAFSRPRHHSAKRSNGADPLEAIVSAKRHPSGCALFAAGNGPTILLVHGWESSHRDLDTVARALLDGGYRVVALDLPAHGVTPGRTATIPQLSEAIRRVVEYPIGFPVSAVVAHSLGGAAALRAIARLERQIPLVLIASPSRARTYLQNMIEGFGLPPHRIGPILTKYRDLHDVDLNFIDAAIDAPLVRAQVLLLYGMRDRLVPPSEGQRYEGFLANAGLHHLSQLGHRGILRAPQVQQAVLKFLGRHVPPARNALPMGIGSAELVQPGE
ncbi:alpha/beta hydrolase [Erythrobacter sp.]|uniref:alpha/beta fold hydrolase n=1 Tax=Erythrobacter sp. TaxID=1042 RepID=UPI001B0179B5|nr:alpha/beta hydrolase [Erythrobacter sp.]MBO6527469.1 alpha/beta fold hydrolase [Erythrobacter sp.]MBO6530852.1 alpha/beta fold hydrolase [Erythrobacter sp.]